MKNKYLVLGAVVAVVGGFLVLGTSSVSAFRDLSTKYGPNHTEEREVQMDSVLKKQDLTAWKALMTENGRTPRVVDVVDTKAELAKFAQMREYQHNGEFEKAQEIRTQLGLGNGQGRGRGMGR